MRKTLVALMLLILIAMTLFGIRYYIGIQMVAKAEQGNYAVAIEYYDRFGTYLDQQHQSAFQRTLHNALMAQDFSSLVHLSQMTNKDQLPLLFPLDKQQQLFVHLDALESPEPFLTLFNFIESEASVAITVAALSLYKAVSDVELSNEGVSVDDEKYGTHHYTLQCQEPIYFSIDKGPFKIYEGPFTLTPQNSILTYHTVNRYGYASIDKTISLSQRPFKDLMRLQEPMLNSHKTFEYRTGAEHPLFEGEKAVFYVNGVFYIANQPYQWHYGETLEAFHLDGIIQDYEGYIDIEHVDMTLRMQLESQFNEMTSVLDREALFYLGSITGPLPKPLATIPELRNWQPYKDAVEGMLEASGQSTYLYHNLLIGRISEEAPILYVKIYDPGSHYKDGLRIVFGDTYANVYRFKQETLESDSSLLTPTHYDEIPVYSTRLDADPLTYGESIESLAATFNTEGRTDRQLVRQVGDYIVGHLKYDRPNQLSYDSHTPYKALEEGLGVCESYAGLAHDLLKELGVETWFIHADDDNLEDDTHAYNLILVDGEYLFYDFTWADKQNWTDYRYFGFDLGFHPYKPYISDIVLEAFDLDQ